MITSEFTSDVKQKSVIYLVNRIEERITEKFTKPIIVKERKADWNEQGEHFWYIFENHGDYSKKFLFFFKRKIELGKKILSCQSSLDLLTFDIYESSVFEIVMEEATKFSRKFGVEISINKNFIEENEKPKNTYAHKTRGKHTSIAPILPKTRSPFYGINRFFLVLTVLTIIIFGILSILGKADFTICLALLLAYWFFYNVITDTDGPPPMC